MSKTNGRPSALAIWLDLLVIVGVGLLTVAPVVFLGDTSVLGLAQIPLGMALVFFLPGYAAVAAFYPSSCSEIPEAETAGVERTNAQSGPSPLERLVLAVGLSLMAVPLVVLTWNFTPWGIAAPQVLGSLVAIVIVGAVIAAYRRATRPAATIFHLPLDVLSLRRVANDDTPSRKTTVSVSVMILVVLSVVAVSMAVAVPENGEAYTEMYLLSEDPESGELGTDDYPATLPPGEPREIHVGIGNRESRTTTYTVVVKLQRIESVGEERRVIEEVELDRFTTSVESGEGTRIARNIVADGSVTGEDLKLVFLLYKGAPPSEPSVSNAYREVHIWVAAPSE